MNRIREFQIRNLKSPALLFILPILSIHVNFSFLKTAGRDKPCPYSLAKA